jgi:hypothetical protein
VGIYTKQEAAVVLAKIFLAASIGAAGGASMSFALGASQAWILAALAGAYLGIIVAPALVVATAPHRGRVLLLRRFHQERLPNFPVSRAFGILAGAGFEVITLADSIVRSDRNTVGILFRALSVTIALFPTVLLMVGLSISGSLIVMALVDVASPLGATLIGLGIALSYASVYFVPIGGRSVAEWIMTPIEAVLFRFWDRAGLGRLDLRQATGECVDALVLRPLRRRWQAGPVVILASDQNWRQVVASLNKTSTVICIDVSWPSAHLATEAGLLAEHCSGNEILWLHSAQSPPDFPKLPEGYLALDHFIPGCPTFFPYPAEAGKSVYASFNTISPQRRAVTELARGLRRAIERLR